MSDTRHIHLIGICGTAMASLAGLLKQRALKVTGSDAAMYPPMSDFLAAQNIPVAQPYAADNLKPRPDIVVIGNAISRGNPEVEHVLNERIPFKSMAQIMHEEFLMGREVIAVAGTHGKTTTTSMLSWIFESAGQKPSFLIGGIAENFGSSYSLRPTNHFIIEADEYDTAFFDKGPKFMHYFPDSVVLTSVEFDHADIYKDLDAVKIAFKRLVNLVPQRGRIIAHDAQQNLDEVLAKSFCPVERYGFSDKAFWRVMDAQYAIDRTTWKVQRDGTTWGEFECSLTGEYNVLNATAAAAMASHYGIETFAIADAIKTFKSVKRRLEVKAEVNGVTIIDDFAHHPTAIGETLKALRSRYGNRRLWAVLEPRSNTLRRRVFEKELAQSLASADEVVVASIFKPETIAENERLRVSAVIDGVKQSGRPARELVDADAIVSTITPELRSGDVVAILSNGGFGGIYEKLPKAIADRLQ
jgi:UDP-N-acetylmuramate: L-alanyl-gamma-D-glutamyl-meso-diaminopimelate ligase